MSLMKHLDWNKSYKNVVFKIRETYNN